MSARKRTSLRKVHGTQGSASHADLLFASTPEDTSAQKETDAPSERADTPSRDEADLHVQATLATFAHDGPCPLTGPARLTPIPALGDIAQTLLLAGRILLESGAEISRVEETVTRMGIAIGVDAVNVFSTLTGCFVTLVVGGDTLTRLLTVKRRGIDLGRIARVNDLSRTLEVGELDFEALRQALLDVLRQRPHYPDWMRLLARGLSSGAFAMLVGGTWRDFVPAVLAGLFASLVHDYVARFGPEFVAIFFSSMTATMWAVVATDVQFAEHLRTVVVGMMMPLLPGMAFTNAIRDAIAGDLLSGVSRATDATLSAAAIAGGVYAVFLWSQSNLWI